MPAPEANRPQLGSIRRRDPLVLAAVVIAVGLGLTVARRIGVRGHGNHGVGERGGRSGDHRRARRSRRLRGCARGDPVLAVGHWPTVRPFAITAVVCRSRAGCPRRASTAPTRRVRRARPVRGARHGDPDGLGRGRRCGRAGRPSTPTASPTRSRASRSSGSTSTTTTSSTASCAAAARARPTSRRSGGVPCHRSQVRQQRRQVPAVRPGADPVGVVEEVGGAPRTMKHGSPPTR